MLTNKDSEAIEALDLSPIKMKLMHVESGEGWTHARADAVEVEYRRFLYLMKKYPNEQISPTVDVDVFWHYHILDTMKYSRDCEQAFGYFLHHYPYVGMGEDSAPDERIEAGKRMGELYQAEFGKATDTAGQPLMPLAASQAWCAAPSKQGDASWCASPSKNAGTAWCASPSKSAGTAWCASPSRKADTAWCASPSRKADAAWCASPSKNAGSAWCASPSRKTDTAWCASPSKKADAAWCAAPARPTRQKATRTPLSSALKLVFPSSKPAGQSAHGMEELGSATGEFFSIRPRLEATAIA